MTRSGRSVFRRRRYRKLKSDFSSFDADLKQSPAGQVHLPALVGCNGCQAGLPRLYATDQTAEPMVSSAPMTGSTSEAWTRPLATRAVPATVRIWRMRAKIAGFSMVFSSSGLKCGGEEFARLHGRQAKQAGRKGRWPARAEQAGLGDAGDGPVLMSLAFA